MLWTVGDDQQRCITGQEAERRVCGILSPMRNMDPFPSSKGSGIISEVRAREGGRLQGASVFQTQQGSCAYEFTAVVLACIRPVQVQA